MRRAATAAPATALPNVVGDPAEEENADLEAWRGLSRRLRSLRPLTSCHCAAEGGLLRCFCAAAALLALLRLLPGLWVTTGGGTASKGSLISRAPWLLRGYASRGRSASSAASAQDVCAAFATPAPALGRAGDGAAFSLRSASLETASLRRANASGESPPRGAPPWALGRYEAARRAGRFGCFDGSLDGPGALGFDAVNDDFCDCADGSDEPGTAACSAQEAQALEGFACHWADPSSLGQPAIVRHSAVNDGICDCCGGQDEYGSGIACPDCCAVAREATIASRRELDAALEARARYVEYARAHRPQSVAATAAPDAAAPGTRWLRRRSASSSPGVKDYGPDDVFVQLSEGACFRHETPDKLSGRFEYIVCPFRRVDQVDSGRQRRIIGRQGDFARDANGAKDYSKLVMDGGEYCAPARATRRVELKFECAARDAVLNVAEDAPCVYSIAFATPAACPAPADASR